MKKHLNLAAQKNPAAGKSFIHGLPFLALATIDVWRRRILVARSII